MTDTPIEEKTKKKKNDYKDLHNKSMRELVEEDHKTQVSVEDLDEKDSVENKDVESPVKPEEKKETPVVEERKEEQKIDTSKVAEEAATKAAEQATKNFKEELEKIHKSEQSEIDKKKAEDELVSVWDKEKRLPSDYKEIFNESRRIARIEAQREYQTLMAERDRKEQEEQQTKEKERTDVQQRNEQAVLSKTKQVEQEIEELYQAKTLKRPQNITNPDDEGVKETNDFMQFGIQLNQKRVQDGLPPVDSVTKLYFLHYKPFLATQPTKKEQPAGDRAPIAGARTIPQREVPTDQYVYSRDHGKSFRQLVADTVNRVRGS